MSNPYNGYTWSQRSKIIPAYKKLHGTSPLFLGAPCAICNDPHRAPGEWHSEDYSEPYSFAPPESYPVCKACHSRLHKRFNAPDGEWVLFCMHLEAGGYGSEFARLKTSAERKLLCEAVIAQKLVALPKIRDRPAGPHWWQSLTLDPESLEAPWARPRPLRPRPDSDAFLLAIIAVLPSGKERELLRAHASAPRRTASMRQLSAMALGLSGSGTANLLYGKLAQRLTRRLDWTPDQRADGSPIWMSLMGEGWTPPGREFEWTMAPSAATAVRQWIGDR